MSATPILAFRRARPPAICTRRAWRRRCRSALMSRCLAWADHRCARRASRRCRLLGSVGGRNHGSLATTCRLCGERWRGWWMKRNGGGPRWRFSRIFPAFTCGWHGSCQPLGIRNIYYICPQFWAWRPWRANLVRRRFAQALCIFPFEEKFYRDAGVAVEFIGHPLVGNVKAEHVARGILRRKWIAAPSKPIVTILAGQPARRDCVSCARF